MFTLHLQRRSADRSADSHTTARLSKNVRRDQTTNQSQLSANQSMIHHFTAGVTMTFSM